MSIAIPPAVFLGDRLDYWAARTPAKAAFIYGEQSWTYAQWSDRVRRVSGGLKAAGIEHGDRVAFLDKNHPSCLEVTYGAAAIGAAHAVLNWRFAGDELDYAINDCGARVLFVGAELLDQIDLIRDKLTSVEKVIVVGGENDEYEAWLAGTEPIGRDPEVEPDDVCLVMYSSGTTGRPKGVMLTHHTSRCTRSTPRRASTTTKATYPSSRCRCSTSAAPHTPCSRLRMASPAI